MNKTQKAEIVSTLTEEFKSAKAVVMCDYRGLTVSDLESLRKIARAKEAKVQVVKNTLATIALGNAGMSGIDIKDTNIFVWGADAIAASKVAVDFGKDNEKFAIRTAYIDGEAADEKKVRAFATLPGREELLGMLASVWMGPVRNFTIGLDALKRKKEEA
ncbi:MAG: 50S ribosomal protein L10 [Sulfuricurvum sp. MLSB]|jgi:large subunit ribosomal protein L10|uniref:50S ribosomal protein L10 n=1 Tax=Sulfuricurvum sp. MLSB TaxID=1537917 RepID=UPI0005070C60|nr:50S ribosomal protein L10 [Sulfuricurvum sp. MLSB]KFN40606.1 MAG: 50S ribosomal protein L10 [Sulfuricurvum sp. MLSB]